MEKEPVKIVLERKARPGAGGRLVDWIRRLVDSARRSEGLEGSSVLTTGEAGAYIILLRFENRASLDRWSASEEVRGLLAEGESMATAGVPSPPVSGFETWFQLPGLAAPTPPPRWKMALLTWLALVPLVLGVGRVVPRSLPEPVQVAVGTAVPVVLLTWLIMPFLARSLHGWLYGPSRRID
ncbi:MAG: antibiotic biosynthesis monooxygenase [Planctomycetaceae bacterium]|nr:antibiotic biosynthesis monooxygenase [Planctomycetota bacterium]NUN52080.1 antibiotic biosynthesis monooxygenase [Planctomycetaceae bacterium]